MGWANEDTSEHVRAQDCAALPCQLLLFNKKRQGSDERGQNK